MSDFSDEELSQDDIPDSESILPTDSEAEDDDENIDEEELLGFPEDDTVEKEDNGEESEDEEIVFQPATINLPAVVLPETLSETLLTTLPVQPTPAPLLTMQPLKTKEIEQILQNVPGITVVGKTNLPPYAVSNIEDLLSKEISETEVEFQARKKLSRRIATIADLRLNNITSVAAAMMLMKKVKLGVVYDEKVENVLRYLQNKV